MTAPVNPVTPAGDLVANSNPVQPGRLVVVHLQNPREKYWGVLLERPGAGVWVRGMDLGAAECWLQSRVSSVEDRPFLFTVFFPLHRVEKVALDEPAGELPSFGSLMEARAGSPLGEWL